MFRKIFYPTDLSDRSAKDLRWIAHNLTDENTKIVVAHNVETSAGVDTPLVVAKAKEAIYEFCQSNLPSTISFKAIAEAGERTKVLSSIAHKEICSVAIITAPPKGKVISIIQSLAIPQFILRWETPPETPDDLIKNIVIALDLEKERTNFILNKIKSIVEPLEKDIQLTLLHGVPMENPSTAHKLYNQAQKALEKVRTDVCQWHENTTSELVGGQTEEELPSKIEELKTGILVLGLPIKGDIWQLLLGNTAESLIERTKCSIMIIPTN